MRGTWIVLVALVAAACGGHGAGHRVTGPAAIELAGLANTMTKSTTWAGCATRGLVKAPLAQEPGVYQAGPLTLVIGEDPAQLPVGQLRTTGTEAIAVVRGRHPVLLSVDSRSQSRLTLQFDAERARLSESVRFPACGTSFRRVIGGVNFHGTGCARLHVSVAGPAGTATYPMLIPLGNTLRGCPAVSALPPVNVGQVTVGVACRVPNSIRCDRVGVGVEVPGRATLVTASVDGRLVALDPPSPPSDLWQSYLYEAGLRKGPLNTHPAHGRWIGDPPVVIRVRVTVFRPDGTAGAVSETMDLHPGFG